MVEPTPGGPSAVDRVIAAVTSDERGSGKPPVMTLTQRYTILAAAFTAWMFAGLHIQLFILIHRQMMLSLLGVSTAEGRIQSWFTWYQAAFLLGAAAGGWLFGWLGDRWGRTRSLGLSVLCYSLLTLLAYGVTDNSVMLVVRWLACFGIGGVWPNAVALVAEAWPDTSRPFLAGLLGTAANVGAVLLGLIALRFAVELHAWRWVLLVGASPALLGFWILLAVPESTRWLQSRAPLTQAAKSSSVGEVLRPPLLSRTLLGIALGAIPVVGTAANASLLVPWSDQVNNQRVAARAQSDLGADDGEETRAKSQAPAKKADPRSKARTTITRSGGAVFGSLLGGILAAWLGRRITYFLISLLAFGLSSYIFTQISPADPHFHRYVFLMGFVGVTYFGWLPLFLPELFPTRVRSTGAGISFNSGRIVAAAVVLSMGFVVNFFQGDYSRLGFWTGMCYVVGMGIIWFAPRTSDGLLED